MDREKEIPESYRSFGCTSGQWEIVRGDLSIPYELCPVRKWAAQRRDAIARGIPWELTLWDWWSAWQESGHWPERGKKAREYCMCRYGDVGPYSIGNVYIATNSRNHIDAWKSGKQRGPNIRRPGVGVEYRPACKTRPYRAQYKKQKLGWFSTFEEAHQAYLAARESDLRTQGQFQA